MNNLDSADRSEVLVERSSEEAAKRRRRRPEGPSKTAAAGLTSSTVRRMVVRAVDDELHPKLTESVANAVHGVLEASSLSLALIGNGLAVAQGLDTKHAVKQVDRLLSNRNLQLEQLDLPWVRFVLGDRKEVVIALDWTEYNADGHSVIAANVVTSHGRATPLCWKTVKTADIHDGARNDYEDELLLRLRSAIPDDVEVTIIADRGFGDAKLYEFLSRERWAYVIRFREAIHVGVAGRAPVAAMTLVPKAGRARLWKNVTITAKNHPIAGFVAVKAADMKDAWCLATNRTDLTAADVVALYGRRFTIEESFRDAKNPRFGLGLAEVHIRDPHRRDRLIFLAALAQALLTLLGAASEATGLDRTLKANTVKTRTHSLFRQGCMWFALLPNAKEHRRSVLLAKFEELLRAQPFFRDLFGIL